MRVQYGGEPGRHGIGIERVVSQALQRFCNGQVGLSCIRRARLSLSRSPDLINFLVAEGKAGGHEYADAPELPHCTGHVTFTRDQTDRLARRLAIALVGEVDRREELLRTAGVTNLDDYRQALKMRSDIEPLPDTFGILDDITWLRPGFDEALRSLVARGHRLGMRLVVGIPYPQWQTLSRSGASDGFSARVAVGLSEQQASSVLAADVSGGGGLAKAADSTLKKVMIPQRADRSP